MSKNKELNFASIYAIVNKITGTVYIGQAVNTRKRWSRHLGALTKNKASNQHLQRAWNKYGQDNFLFEIIEKFEGVERIQLRELLNVAEIKELQKFNNNCYNLMEAGINGMVASEITKELLSKIFKKRWQNPEYKNRLRKAQLAAWKIPGRKEEHSKTLKESFKDPTYQKRRKEISNSFWAEGGCLRETQSAKRKANWQNPEYVAKQKLARQNAWKDPEIRAKRSKAIKEAHARRRAEKLKQTTLEYNDSCDPQPVSLSAQTIHPESSSGQ